jgi:hypothetical protein
VADNSSKQLDLDRLRKRLREKPRTKAGQVRQAWPDIRDLLAAGHSLKDVWAWLEEIGLEIGYRGLSHYVGQLRRRDEATRSDIQLNQPRRGQRPLRRLSHEPGHQCEAKRRRRRR